MRRILSATNARKSGLLEPGRGPVKGHAVGAPRKLDSTLVQHNCKITSPIHSQMRSGGEVTVWVTLAGQYVYSVLLFSH